MIRQFKDAYFYSCYISTVWRYITSDFDKVTQAYNIEASNICTPDEIEASFSKMWNKVNEPYLLNVLLDLHTNFYPKMMLGSPITKMEPEI